MKLKSISEFLNNIIFPVVSFGIMFLFACDVLFQIYITGKLSDSTEKELLSLIGIILGHWITKKMQSDK